MKKHIKRLGAAAAVITLFLSTCIFAYGDENRISSEEFLEICNEEHAFESRSPHPPGKEPDPFNYEFHYRNVLISPDGSFTDNPHEVGDYRSLDMGMIIMDMEEGYDMSYDFYVSKTGEGRDKADIIPGETITPYYKAIVVSGDDAADKVFEYEKNETDKVPLIPSFPENYDWKKYADAEYLMVYPLVTVKSQATGETYQFEAIISEVTNLYKDTPDCYSLGPTDIGTYTVKPGDSLRKIALEQYGNEEDWIFILYRNMEYINDADIINPEMLLVLPNPESYSIDKERVIGILEGKGYFK